MEKSKLTPKIILILSSSTAINTSENFWSVRIFSSVFLTCDDNFKILTEEINVYQLHQCELLN